MFCLNADGRDLVLPRLNIIDFVTSQWESCPIERSGWGQSGERSRRVGGEYGGELWMKWKIKFLKNKLKNSVNFKNMSAEL